MKLWLVIALFGGGTLLLRGAFVAAWPQGQFPSRVQKILELVPAAALSAVTLPNLIRPHQDAWESASRLLIAIIAGLVAWRTRSLLLPTLVGLGLLWFVQKLTQGT